MMQAVVTMTVLLVPLLFLLTSGVCCLKSKEIYVKAGEMVALLCPSNQNGDAKLTWTSYTTEETDLTNMSSAEQRQMGVLVHGGSLIVLGASVNHQGNYSLRSASRQFWFRLTVNTAQSREHEEETKYSKTCYTPESCELFCPDENTPAVNTPNITSNGITWYKKGESWPIGSYFSRVKEKDSGVYTCTRSYLYHGQIYNMTFTVVLDVKTKEALKTAEIISPHKDEVFPVDLGSAKVINCTAVVFSNFDGVFWLSGKTSVPQNTKSPVFYSLTREKHGDEIKITASLVFKKVSEEDLSKNYTCKLESISQSSSLITIALIQKPRPSYIPLALSIVGIVVVMVVTVVIYVKMRVDITLFLRDTLGCHRSTSDGKSYDAFLMCYKGNTGAGLNAYDRKHLESVLEERFGYSLCLYHRDILPGEAIAEAVLDRIEQCRTVVLVPTSPDPGLGSGVLSAIHAALVERQTRLIFIKTETIEASTSGSLAEALQLLSEAGDCVTWRGMSSMPPSSSFWKQLRYYLPALQHAPKISLLPQTIRDVGY